MRVIVLLKQVPGTHKVDVDENGSLKRAGISSKMNPYDLYALEAAIKIRENYGATITALTMGPGQASEVIKEAFAIGADSGVFLSDRAFAGSDVLATARAISGAIKKLGDFDLIICGKQTTDGDTAQVGPETSEFLNIPHVSNVIEIIDIEEGNLTVKADIGDSIQTLALSFPCLIAVEKLNTPRLPSYKRMRENKDKEICTLSLADLDDHNSVNYGLDGSPTRVERIYPPDVSAKRINIGEDSGEIAKTLYDKLKELKFV